MGKIIVNENVSIDGVFQDPTGEEGIGGADWRAGLAPADREAWAKAFSADALGAAALLLGRRSYEFFAARYPARTGEWADKLNSMPKYVVSGTLQDPGWNSTVLKGDVVDAVSAVKHELAGDIVVYASSRLVRTLIEHDLVDELTRPSGAWRIDGSRPPVTGSPPRRAAPARRDPGGGDVEGDGQRADDSG